MIATVDNPSNAAEWALAEMVNRLVSLLSVLPQLKFWASYATGHGRSKPPPFDRLEAWCLAQL